MRLTFDNSEFIRRVRWISDHERLERLGFTTCSPMGSFFPSAAQQLLDFCAEHPEYHVVSYLGDGIFVNHYDPNAGVYKLADGDKDPNYKLNAMQAIRGVVSFLFG